MQMHKHTLKLQWFADGGAEGGEGGGTAVSPQSGAEGRDEAPALRVSRAEERQARAAGTLKPRNPLAAVRYGKAGGVAENAAHGALGEMTENKARGMGDTGGMAGGKRETRAAGALENAETLSTSGAAGLAGDNAAQAADAGNAAAKTSRSAGRAETAARGAGAADDFAASHGEEHRSAARDGTAAGDRTGTEMRTVTGDAAARGENLANVPAASSAAPAALPGAPFDTTDPAAAQAARVRAIRESWRTQSEALKETYPEFDFAAERANPRFAELVKRGVPLRSAYEAAHFDSLLEQAVARAARETEQGVARRLAQNRARPDENGLHPGGAALVKTDVAALSRADREEIERRVMHGEKISF